MYAAGGQYSTAPNVMLHTQKRHKQSLPKHLESEFPIECHSRVDQPARLDLWQFLHVLCLFHDLLKLAMASLARPSRCWL